MCQQIAGEQLLGPLADVRARVVHHAVGAGLPDALLTPLDEFSVARQHVGFEHGVLDRERVPTERVFPVEDDRHLEAAELDGVARQSVAGEPPHAVGRRLDVGRCRRERRRVDD